MKQKLILFALSSVAAVAATAQVRQTNPPQQATCKPYVSEVWNPDLGNGKYKNPVINADYSDPDVICVGDDYYMTASSFNCIPGLPILHSKDLVNWELINHAVKKLQPEEVFNKPSHGNGVWAPCISYHNGEYYIYWGDPDYGVFMVKTKDPAGKWDDPVCVISGKGMIDTSPLWDDDGRVYLVNGWANSRNRFASVLTVRELSADGTKAISDPVIVFDGNGTEYRTAEGPKFYKRQGWYWLMFPAGGVPTGFQVAARSKTPHGPYEYKMVMAQGKSKINGPHQGGWVHTKYGEDWFIHFQDKDAYGRVVHLQPVTWKDNWPVMGKVPNKGYCGEPYEEFTKPKSSNHVNVNPVESDEFNEPKLGLQWQWHANYQQWFGMPTSMGVMRIYTDKNDGNIWDTPNLLLQKTPSDDFTATAKLRLTAKEVDQMGGIIMMGLDYSALVVKRVGDDFQLQQIICHSADKGKPEEVKVLQTLKSSSVDKTNYQPAIHCDVYLRMVVSAGKVKFYFSSDGKKYVAAGDVFKMREGKWIGAKIGLVCKEPAGKNNRGWIDADWFRITKN